MPMQTSAWNGNVAGSGAVREVLDWAGLPADLRKVLRESPSVTVPKSRRELFDLATQGEDEFEVAYDIPSEGCVVDVHVARCTNGLAINYSDPYMRRRDPECMVIGDELPTDKPRYKDRFGQEFEETRQQTFDWLAKQPLLVLPMRIGAAGHSAYEAVMVAPENAAFFVGGMADLQTMLAPDEVGKDFKPRCVVYVAPPFRRTHFDKRQIVVHNRRNGLHEVFSYNLYPGPSAKKGIYGVLLSIGEEENWLTLHGSTVRLVTPYDNVTVIMHEGASGAGKSEMLEYVHREEDGRLLLGRNCVTGERKVAALPRACELQPVTDDMAMCHPALQDADYLAVNDAEQGWFVRLDHIRHYGTDPFLERLTVHPPEPLLFLNVRGVPNSTCLIWEHAMDSPDTPCPNPRVILPRRIVPNVVDRTVQVGIRNFGLRAPVATRENPTYGIAGFLHVLPPAIAWLWRLAAPRGHANPSITEGGGLTSEGIGSYWPFATGRRVDHANLLLRQFQSTPRVRYTLTPNQHVGCWQTGFMPQWIAREYLARRGTAPFMSDHLEPARCVLLGWALHSLHVEEVEVPAELLRTELQPELGVEGYDAGAGLLVEFFRKEASQYDTPRLDPLGRQIIQCLLDGGGLTDFEQLLPSADRLSAG